LAINLDFQFELGISAPLAEINPLFVLPRGQGVRAADGVVVLG
jgi:succinyl-CoA synthetase beta subunit